MALVSQIKLPDNSQHDLRASAIPYGIVDASSTSTAYTATVPGITALEDGVTCMLKNGVVTSASGFKININGLGAKPVYNNMAAATADTTIFNINYTMLFVYDSTRVSGGCWICYRGYNSDNNTIGYQIRTNSTAMPTTTRTRYYRILFTSADNTHWVPANTGYDNSATSKKTVNTVAINPFGRIVYMTGTTNVNANDNIGATVVWDQYAFALGYSFNTAGTELTLTFPAPVYVKCTPQANGSAIIDSTEPYVQGLPNTADGKIYIYLGVAYSATNIELVIDNPIYFHDGSGIKLWTGTVIPTKTSELTNDSGFLTSHQDISGKADKATTLSGYGITDAKIASGVITLGSNTITPLTSSSTLSAAKLSGAIPSAVTATTQASTDNSTKIATTAYVTTAIANLPEPMLFKGSVGTGGTVTSLPTAAAANEGWTYKVITALSSPAAKVGDTVISNGSSWVVIPSGDEPSGTVTSVAVSNATNGGLSISGSPITSSGTISIGHSNVLSAAQTTQAVYPIKIDKNGHISAYGSAVSIPTKVSDLTNDSGFITSYTETDPTVPSWAKADSKPAYTYSEVGAAASSHSHGNITSGGDITATAPTIANGDQIIINDNSASKITNGPTFDGSTTTKALTPKGTWETFLQSHQDISGKADKATTLAGYGITDAKIASGVITLGSNTITPLTSVTLNGSSSTSPSFYAPTSAGTSGYYLKSSGSGAPTWNSFPTIVNTRGTATSGGTTLSVVNTGDMYTWNNKQAALVSGTNIKTINNTSLLGSGNISITNTDTKVKLTSNTGSTSIPLVLGPTSITSGTAYECLYNTSLSYTPSTKALVAGDWIQVNSWKWDGATVAGHFSLVYVS